MFPNFAPESPLSREKFLSAIFNLLFEIPPSDLFKNCATVVYFILPPACQRSLTSVSFYVTFPFLVLNNNHSTKDPPGFLPCLFSHSVCVRSPFGIRRIIIPRPHKNQNALTTLVPSPTKTRPRGPSIDRAWKKSLAKQEQNAR